MKRLLLVPLAMLLASCGALFNGSPANVSFNSDPAGAEIWIDGTQRGTTPAILPLAKNRNYAITFKRQGFADTSAELTRKVSGGYVILDILGGILPVVVDAATGSWYVLSTNNVSMNLREATTLDGRLEPQELAAVRLGVSVNEFVEMAELLGAN